MNEITVGLPRALLFYKFEQLWKVFFQELGVKIQTSPPTNKAIKELSIKYAPDEDCYSTKLYFGHTLVLKDQVDYLFIPRFHSDHPTNVSCPKFLGVADVLRSMFPDLPQIIRPYFSMAKSNHGYFYLFRQAFIVGWRFTKNPLKIINAVYKSLKAHKRHLRELHLSKEKVIAWEKDQIRLTKPKLKEGEEPLKIALVGHSYVLNDPIPSIEIKKKLNRMGIDIITSEQMPRDLVEKQMEKLDHNMFFQYEREILGTIMHYLESGTIDGIVHLIIFSCGPDSIVGELASRFAHRSQKIPLLQLTLDELTGEAGLNTRLEAFTDMIKRRKQKFHSHIQVLEV